MGPWKFFRLFLALLASPLFFQSQTWGIPAEGSRMMISAPSPYGVEVGEKIARMGGNAVDVAVAVGLTLGVTSPYFASLGGGGFALVKMGSDPVHALDFRETSPGKTSPTFYTEDSKRSSQDGGAAVGTPGNVLGLFELHKKYGKLAWKTLLETPIQLAEKGFKLSGEWVSKTESQKERFNFSGKKTFFRNGKESYKSGENFLQPQLAKALKQLRDRGAEGFYTGPVAEDLVASIKEAGGVMSLEDLKNYKVRWLEPIKTSYKGFEVYLMPPPSSGGVVIAQALKLVEKVELSNQALLSTNELHLLGEIQARAYRSRALLGDPDFSKNPVDELLEDKNLASLSKTIHVNKVTKLPPLAEKIEPEKKESTETTHFTVMDNLGNTVSLTYTLNGNYGSGVVSEKFRIALNNEMDDFTTKPGEPNMYGLVQGQANKVEPGKRPLSSMSPTIVLENGKTVLALGAPGGPRIISSVFQVLYRVLGQGMDLDLAVQTPRVHHQFLPPTLYVDKQRLSPEIIAALTKKGHKVEESWMAKVYAIQRSHDGVLKAAFDSRGEGAAGGY